ncbi:MAG: hypothetical protein GDA43_17400 [Hormoscilla sp. SP5CHS1]|nr:hypothetical protein [Hormoscilla sp. SP12CHS1]MBC6454756.1 hypothetical protein [Hormoscilla sp. SP5CHS1]MBC6471983.1 hypothetical protein [Hormoscilla sp. GM102CHS1]
MMEFKSSGVVAAWCEPDNPVQFAQCLRQVLQTHPRKVEGYDRAADGPKNRGMEVVRQFSWESIIAKILSHVDSEMLPPLP